MLLLIFWQWVQDKMAESIHKIAEQYNVPVLRNIPLAHNLWDEGELYEYVPEDTYEAVAEIIAGLLL